MRLPGGEVILDVESLPDLLGCLSFTSTSQEYDAIVRQKAKYQQLNVFPHP